MADLEIRAFNRRLLVVWDKRKVGEGSELVQNLDGDFDPAESGDNRVVSLGFRGEVQ